MTATFSDVKGIGSTTAERLVDAGYEEWSDIMGVDEKKLADEVSGLREDVALRAVVHAEDVLESTSTDSENVPESEDTTSTESESEDTSETQSVSLNLDDWQYQLLVRGLVQEYSRKRTQDLQRAKTARTVADKLEDNRETVTLTADELNVLYGVVRENIVEHKGNNNIEMMNQLRTVMNQIEDAR